MISLRLLVSILLSCAPVLLSAQATPAPDTLPFRTGQWAAQFSGGAFASLGFLRFTAPTRAWLVDFVLSGGHAHDQSRVNDSLVSDGFRSNAFVTARLGRRFFQSRGKSVLTAQTVGVLAGFSHSCDGNTLQGTYCDNGWTAGVFGELGGAYLITQRFSIGGSAGASFTYQRSKTSNLGSVNTTWSYQGLLQGLSFAATIYF
ncbi:MAG TPA: hypothetical protein VH158_00545 [Gemmatimonadales bacterium]|nr:hypothetical protein [Gemmatimonadales bacterium]